MTSTDIGKDPSRIDDEQPGDETVADALGFELTDSDGQSDSTTHAGNGDAAISAMSMEAENLNDCPETDEIDEIDDLTDLIGVVRSQQELIARLGTRVASQQETIDELTDDMEEVSNDVEEVSDDVDDLEERVDDVEETADQSVATSKEIAATVNGAIEESNTESDETEGDSDSESTDTGPGEASSPMDFFLNCQQYHVNQSLSANRARAVKIVRRRAEFAKRRNGDGRLFFDAEAMKEALLAIMGEQPHRETQQRVWRYVREMGGPDITEIQSMVDPSNQQSKKVVLEIDDDADDRFDEGRYIGLNLLADMNSRDVAQGGVTPVVTGVNA
ncbi:hypothetical protein [Saliphagus sp. LR7]|uniref:hypothetical protein n=1 Tax=Saliphagus sp. LR7 TaxID=2282654 RepID=UPI000DF7ED33|nr:hypothetical protein [Saliphagus sp. LR7]